MAADFGLPTVATTAAHYARPERVRLADALAAIRARRGIDELEGWLPADGTAFLRSGAEMAAMFRRYPGAVGRAAVLGVECAFELDHLELKLPPFEVPGGGTEMDYLRKLTEKGWAEKFKGKEHAEKARAQIGQELFISPKTASVHVSNILRKLAVTTRVQAATIAERAGLLD